MVRDKTIRTLTSSSPSLPYLPVELIPEILCRLPAKSLLQFRCVCKSWKSLISDPIFAKKHHALSTTYSLHCQSYSACLKSYSLDSTLIELTHVPYNNYVYLSGSCHGIFCLINSEMVQLWNPSIRKFKELPSITEPENNYRCDNWMYGFGYDPISDNYKVVVVLLLFGGYTDDYFSENEVKVHTLGTDSWKNVSMFPFNGVSAQPSGQYASGTINWLAYPNINQGQCFIASFDLGNESYQKVLLPDYGEEDNCTLLSVFKDCLCLISRLNVWVMKEYGNKESWTKLFTISYDPCPSSYSNIHAKQVFEDVQVLLCKEDDRRWKYIFYNCKNHTSKFIESENTLEVCVESLISPYF